MAFVMLLLLISSSGISALSTRTYTVPICAPNSFYCYRPQGYTCLLRTQRCTSDADSDSCTQTTAKHCEDAGNGRFRVRRHSSELDSSGSSSRREVITRLSRTPSKFPYKLEHQFITYRGLMYEFGDYGTRVQDPNDPDYEYETRSESGSPVDCGTSSCTYQQVERFLDIWANKKYSLAFNNCQHFATGLVIYLTGDCTALPNSKRQTDDELAEYISRISRISPCDAESPDGSQSVAPISMVTFSTTILIGVLAIMHLL